MTGQELMDAPNQQAVRPDGSHPSEEGSGGSAHDDPKPKRSSSRSSPKETEEE
jgi:hypothetical protein